MGLRSALATYHVTWSMDGGWHYHCHMVVEWEANTEFEELGAWVSRDWEWAKMDSGEGKTDVFVREVVGPGPAFGEGEIEGQGELWKESRDPVLAALQYVVRDVLQGVEKWVGRITNVEDAGSFAEAVGGAKLHRLYGVWRKQLGKRGEAAAPVEGAGMAPAGSGKTSFKDGKAWTIVGRMDAVLWEARSGVAQAVECVRRLLSVYSNKGLVWKRLVRTVRGCVG